MTSPVMIMDFFPEMTLGDSPKKPRIRVNGDYLEGLFDFKDIATV